MSYKVSDIAVGLLVEAADNPNSMDAQQLEMLGHAIKKVGFLQPALVRQLPAGRYEIIDGHHRIKAARELGYTDIPCVVLDNSDDAKAVALRIGMNRLRGELNLAAVARELDKLVEAGWGTDDLGLTGFNPDEVEDLLESLNLQAEDDVLGQKIDGPEADDAPPDPFVLEITFADRDTFKRAKAGLKRAAGSGDLSKGLMRLLGE